MCIRDRYIMINTLHSLFIDEPITDIAKYCLALAVHESLHPLYSSFQCIGDAARKRPSETDNVVEVRQSVLNILEDARIERIGKFKFPGVASVSYTHLFRRHQAAGEIPAENTAQSCLCVFIGFDLPHLSPVLPSTGGISGTKGYAVCQQETVFGKGDTN